MRLYIDMGCKIANNLQVWRHGHDNQHINWIVGLKLAIVVSNGLTEGVCMFDNTMHM